MTHAAARPASPLPPALDRASLIFRLRERPQWDVVVVGGGATGLGCALDAAARGHSTLLLEAHDFAQGTSSRSTKLIHGGVRYLAQGRIGLVREALAERWRLLANAPHLVHPLRFILPAYRPLDRIVYGAGLGAYGWLAGLHRIAPVRRLSAGETLAALPNLRRDGLHGGIAYFDAQFDDARLAVTLMRSIFDHGGLALNYLPVTGLLRTGNRITGVTAQDAEGGEEFRVQARAVINATGVWSDALRRLDDMAPAQIAPVQGSHLVVGQGFLSGESALVVPRAADGRILFMIPWQGRVLVGSTETPCADAPLEPAPRAEEVDFILGTAARYLEQPPQREDVRSAFAGLRPLLGDKGNSARLPREHRVSVSAHGLVTVAGGKWTTYRRMAEEAVDAAQESAGLPRHPCPTAALRLHAATTGQSADPYGEDREIVESLPGAGRRLHPDLKLAESEVRFAVRYEMARRVEDVLARRHRALFLDALVAAEAAPEVARILADELGHDAAWRERECAAFGELAQRYMDLPE